MMDVSAIPCIVAMNLTTGMDRHLFAKLSCVNTDLKDIIAKIHANPISNQIDLNDELKRLGTTALDLRWSPRFPVPRMQLQRARDLQPHVHDMWRVRQSEADEMLAKVSWRISTGQFHTEMINAYVDGLSHRLDRVAIETILGLRQQ